jgi:DNA-binding response OmpR family regulator
MKKILVADDDPDIVEVVSIMLESRGFEVCSTLLGQSVFSMVKSQRPDLVVLDIRMPDMDGRDVCKLIKDSQETKSIPVLMFSANRNVGQSALDSGADDFLDKPFNMQDLLAKVTHLAS